MSTEELRKAVEYADGIFDGCDNGEWAVIRQALRDQEAEIAGLQSVLLSAGFVPCDSAECNCNSWHHKFGLAARFRELQDELREAGVLDSATGSRPIDGVRKLIEQRDSARITAHLGGENNG